MKKLMLVVVGLITVLGIGVAATLHSGGESTAQLPGSAKVSEEADLKPAPTLFAQSTYSTRCATKSGICELERPQRVGTPCKCGGETGRVVP